MSVSRLRWAVSLADLALLLLGCALWQQASAPGTQATHPAARPAVTVAAAPLFEPGEARLSTAGHRWADGLARHGGRFAITSSGMPAASARLDAFELAAARAAAAARAIEARTVAAGAAGDGRVDVAVESGAGAQRLTVRYGVAPPLAHGLHDNAQAHPALSDFGP